MLPPRSLPSLAAGAALLALVVSTDAAAQSLRGSRESIDRMYRQAVAEELPFYETGAGVRRAAAAGRLVRLEANRNVVLHRIGFPYVAAPTRTFVQRLGAQYRDACGEQLVVTSAVRPATRQPANATERSVHPTGMAIDLRKPRRRACLRWLRATLLDLEREGVLEATEERAPAHFHVAIFPTAYTRYASGRAKGDATTTATTASPATTTYTVRPGDTLWSIARDHDTTVDVLARMNDLGDGTIHPGQELRIPGGG